MNGLGSLPSLLAWAQEEGVRIQKLRPSQQPNSREFVLTEGCEPGETLISIPQHLLLHAGVAFADPAYGACFRELANEPGVDSRTILCLLLVLERAKQGSSRWAPYMSILPDSYDDPFWWRDEQLRLLKGTRLGRAVQQYHSGLKRLAQLAARLEQLYSAAQPPGSPPGVLSTYKGGWGLTEAAARWARSSVWSRSFTVRSLADGSRNAVAMVPVLDMIDHSPSIEVVWHTGMDGSEPFQFVPLAAVPQGSVMVNNYGSKTSDELLLAYGFLLQGPNPADYFQVSLAHSRQQQQQGQGQLEPNGMGGGPSGPLGRGLHGHGSSSGGLQAHGMGSGGNSGPASMDEDEGEDDPAVQQQQAEDLQRLLALSSLNLQMEHQLTLRQPLPDGLVQGAQLCLAPPPALYVASAQLLTQQLAGSGRVNGGLLNTMPSDQQLVGAAGAGGGDCGRGSRQNSRGSLGLPPGAIAAPAGGLHQGCEHLPTVGEEGPGSGSVSTQRQLSGHKRSLQQAGLGSQPSLEAAAGGGGGPSGSDMGEHAAGCGGAAALLQRPGSPTSTNCNKIQNVRGTRGLLPILDAPSAMHIVPAARTVSPGRRMPGSRRGQGSETAGGTAFGAGPPNSIDGAAPGGHPGKGPNFELPQALQAMVSLYQQLDSKLRGMVPDVDEERALAGVQPAGSASAAVTATGSSQAEEPAQVPLGPPGASSGSNGGSGGSTSSGSSGGSGGGGSSGPKPEHTLLAVSYVRSQKAIIRAALDGLQARISSHVHNMAAAVSPAACAGAFRYLALTSQPQLQGPPQQPQSQLQGLVCSIDPEVHLQHYSTWLSRYGMLGTGPDGQVPELCTEDLGEAAGVQGLGSAAAETGSQAMDTDPPGCGLQEVVCRRELKPAAGSGSGPGVAGEAGSSGAGAGSAGVAGRPNGRGPPSASRTFRAAKPLQGGAGGASASAAGAPMNGSGGSAAQAGAGPPKPPPKRVAMPQGMGASLGLDSDHDPVVHGAVVLRDAAPGDVLLTAPAACCFLAPSKQRMVRQLMAAGYQLLQGLLSAVMPHALGRVCDPAAATAAIAAATVSLSSPQDMLTWHLMHSVAASPACRLHMSDVEGVQLLADMLEDSPAGGALQEAYESLEADFQQLRAQVCGPGKMVLTNGRGGSGSGGEQMQMDPLWRLLTWNSSFGLFCWATNVVDRCAVRISGPLPPAAAALLASGGGRAGGPRARRSASSLGQQPEELWVIAPVLAAVPPELRSAVLYVRLQQQSEPGTGAAQAAAAGPASADAQQQPRAAADTTASASVKGLQGLEVVVAASCSLRRGLPLTPLLLVPTLDCEELVCSYGPEALVWRCMLHGGAARNGGKQGPSGDAAPASSAAAPAAAQQAAVAVPHMLSSSYATCAPGNTLASALLYELYICPSEEDALCSAKLGLLTASGLGCVHFLTEDLHTLPMVGAALKISLASEELLSHPLSQQCLQHYAALRAVQAEADDASAAGTLQAAPASASGPGGSALPSTSCHDGSSNAAADAAAGSGAHRQAAGPAASQAAAAAASEQQQALLRAAQVRLLSMLASLPDDHPVCRAARKQLRPMVHDARKNSRRRLKQLEVVRTHAANLPSNAATTLSAFGGSYNPLGGSTTMHEGVQLYLQALCGVLDVWGEHLGLNRQSDSYNSKQRGSQKAS